MAMDKPDIFLYVPFPWVIAQPNQQAQSNQWLNRFNDMSKRKKQRTDSRKRPGEINSSTRPGAETMHSNIRADKKSSKSIKKKKSVKHRSTMTRRNAIRMLIALPVAGAAGAAIHRYDVQNRGLHDLALIGQGTPVVVQIHDPKCQQCRRLMNNTRKALESQDDVLFRVADITSSDGAQFQRKYNADTVSLLLFNADGVRVDTVNGVKTVDELEKRFASLN